jgi:hypothetical protein
MKLASAAAAATTNPVALPLSEQDELLVAGLACEYFEAARDGLAPDLDAYLAKLPDPRLQELFIISTNMSALIAMSLRHQPRDPANPPRRSSL